MRAEWFHGPTRAAPWLVAAVVGAAALAGCMHGQDDTDPGMPEPVLSVEPSEVFRGTNVTIDASASTVREGTITDFHIETGDGTVYEAREPAEARIGHEYQDAGRYTIRLSVSAEDALGERRNAQTTHDIVVHDRVEIGEVELHAVPIDGLGQDHRLEVPFEMDEDAESFELALNVTNTSPAGSAALWLRVQQLRAEEGNQTLEEETYTLAPGETTPLDVAGASAGPGAYRIVLEANEGNVRLHGRLIVWYANEAAPESL